VTKYATEHAAEKSAANYLAKQGFKIKNINWHTPRCEIDIVAEKDNTIYLVEVKYRASNQQGQGLDYITPKKLQQMKFAAEVWASQNDWQGEYCLAALGIDGDKVEFTELYA